MSQNREDGTSTGVPPLLVGLAGNADDAVSSSVTARSLSLTTTSGVKSSDAGSSGREHAVDGVSKGLENILVPKAVQQEEHYKQLLEQGKLRHGSIIKKKKRWNGGSQGNNVVLDMDGNAHRMPKTGSQSSLVASESSLDTSQSKAAAAAAGGGEEVSSLSYSDAGSTAGDTARTTRGYSLREREGLNELWILIVNGLKKKVWEKNCASLLKQLSLVKWKVYMTRYPGHARKIAYRAQNKGADMIIVVGGDGTMHEVVDGMMRSHCKDDMGLPKATLSILPAGSSNDFLRSMGWSLDFEEGMWRLGNRGETALVDVGKVTCIGPKGSPISRYWLNIASFGVSGRISGKTDGYRIWGPLTFKVAGFIESLKYIIFKKSPILVSYDEGEWEFVKNMTLMAACNGDTFATGMKISTCASPFSGELDMVLIQCGRNMISIATAMDHFSKGTPSRSSVVSNRRCKRVDIVAADSRGNPIEESLLYSKQGEGDGNELHDFSREDSNVSEDIKVSVGIESTQYDDETEVTSAERRQESSIPGKGNQSALKSIQQARKEDIKRLVAHRYPLECDGECIGHLPATFEVIPRALKLRIPKVSST